MNKIRVSLIVGMLILGTFVILTFGQHPILSAVAYILLLGWYLLCRSKWKGTLSVLLCGALLLQPLAAQAPPLQPEPSHDPQSTACVMAVVVIVVGAIVIYQLWSFCKKHFPPPPPPPDNKSTNQITGLLVTNADMPAPGDRQFTMNCKVAPDGSLSLAPASYWDDSMSGLSAAQWLSSVPAIPAEVDVSCAGGVLSIIERGQGTRTIVLERSTDLQTWMPIATNVWSSRFEQVSEVDLDAPEGMAFYRVH